MDKEMHYVIYQITNLVNGKIYIGKHKTENLDDGYMGSGTLLKRAIQKYGIENFKKEILFECSSDEELFNKERELVNEDFVARDDKYNLKVGGDGGFDYINKNNLSNIASNCSLGGKENARLMREDKSYRELVSKRISNGLKRVWKDNPNLFRNFHCDWTGRHHSEETKKKIGEKSKLLTGDKNGAFGRVWIHNDIVKRNLMIKRELVVDYLSQEWSLGSRVEYYHK